MRKDSFFERVYLWVKRIPRGQVATYGQIARLAGQPHAARMVGWAMHASSPRNPIPWHRVVGAGGRIVISKAAAYAAFQRQLLEREGVKFRGERIVLREFQWPLGLQKRTSKKRPLSKR